MNNIAGSESNKFVPDNQLHYSLEKLNVLLVKTSTILIKLQKEYIQLGGSKDDLDQPHLIKPIEFELPGLEKFARNIIGHYSSTQRKQHIQNSIYIINTQVQESNKLIKIINNLKTNLSNKIQTRYLSLIDKNLNQLEQAIKSSRIKNDSITYNEKYLKQLLDNNRNKEYKDKSQTPQIQTIDPKNAKVFETDSIQQLHSKIKEAEQKMIASATQTKIEYIDQLSQFARINSKNLHPSLKDIIYYGLGNKFQIGVDFLNNVVAYESDDDLSQPTAMTLKLTDGNLSLYTYHGKVYKVFDIRTKIQTQINEERNPKDVTSSDLVGQKFQTLKENLTTSLLNPTVSPEPEVIENKKKLITKVEKDNFNSTLQSLLSRGFCPKLEDEVLVFINQNNQIQNGLDLDPDFISYCTLNSKTLEELSAHLSLVIETLISTITKFTSDNPNTKYKIIVEAVPENRINLGLQIFEDNDNVNFVKAKLGGQNAKPIGLTINNNSGFAAYVLSDPKIVSLTYTDKIDR